MRRVVVTGLGLVTPLATGTRASWQKLISNQSGIVSLVNEKSHLSNQHVQQIQHMPATIAGLVQRGPIEQDKFDASLLVDYKDDRKLSPFMLYGMAAAREALQDAGWDSKLTDKQKERTGVCIGSGIGAVDEIAATSQALLEHGLRKVGPFFVPKILINLVAGHVSIKYGFQGPNHSVSTACTTGAHSLGDAMRFIQYGDADVMVAGSAESCISPLGLSGFCRAKSLVTTFNDQPTLASRPFDKKRDGFVMGEGAGIMVLEEYEHAKARGAYMYAEITGYGLSADAHHYTAPPPEGQGAQRAMKRALQVARIDPDQVHYINCHATSTPLGDAAENRAIKSLFKKTHPHFCVSSTKGATGHLLGAAGSVEAIFTVLALNSNCIPATLNLEQVEDEQEFNLDYVPLKSKQATVLDVALTNSFGFGGTNCSLCFQKVA